MQEYYAVGLEEAMVAVHAGIEEAKRKGVRVALAVVDGAGAPVLVARMDGVSCAAVRFATEKAQAAAWTGVDTLSLEQSVSQRPGFAATGLLAVEGGVPVLFRSQVVGAIAVSGAQASDDAGIGRAALSALESVSKASPSGMTGG